MEGIKVLLSAFVLALLVLAVAVNDARVAGETAPADSTESSATLGEVLQATQGEESDEESGEEESDLQDEAGDVSSSVDVKVDLDFSSSSKVDVDFSSSVEGSTDTAEPPAPSEETDEGEGQEQSRFTFTINGQTVSCKPGERWRSPDRNIRCKNDEDSAFQWRVRSDSD